jgi:hypothetical protein
MPLAAVLVDLLLQQPSVSVQITPFTLSDGLVTLDFTDLFVEMVKIKFPPRIVKISVPNRNGDIIQQFLTRTGTIHIKGILSGDLTPRNQLEIWEASSIDLIYSDEEVGSIGATITSLKFDYIPGFQNIDLVNFEISLTLDVPKQVLHAFRWDDGTTYDDSGIWS